MRWWRCIELASVECGATSSSTSRTRTSVHAERLDCAYRDKGDELDFRAVGHLSTRDVAAVLERMRDRMVKWLRRRGPLLEDCDAEGDGLAVLAASAVAGTTPPAGPEWRRGALPFERQPMVFERPWPGTRRSRRLQKSR